MEKLFDDVLEEIKTYYMEVCQKLINFGYSTIKYRMNDEEFSETCEENEYNFYENGKMANL